MRPFPRIRHWTALLALPLALWSSLPTVRWCTDGWNQVQVACFLPCVAGLAGANAPRETEPACEASSTCEAASGACASTTSAAADPACEEGAEFPCGLTFCLDGPTGGDGVPAEGRAPLHEPSVFTAILPAPPGTPEAPVRHAWTLGGADDSPASPTRARSHQARAPPASA